MYILHGNQNQIDISKNLVRVIFFQIVSMFSSIQINIHPFILGFLKNRHSNFHKTFWKQFLLTKIYKNKFLNNYLKKQNYSDFFTEKGVNVCSNGTTHPTLLFQFSPKPFYVFLQNFQETKFRSSNLHKYFFKMIILKNLDTAGFLFPLPKICHLGLENPNIAINFLRKRLEIKSNSKQRIKNQI